MARARTAQHGTRTRYTGGCRCTACRKANNDYQQARAFRLGLKVPMSEHLARVAAKHGSRTMYTKGCRCDSCREAAVGAQREYRRRHQDGEREVPLTAHGTNRGYGYYGCRCERCKAVWSLKNKREAEARKARAS